MDPTENRARPQVWRRLRWGAIAVLLLAPLLAMQFTDEVQWTALDFLAAATLLCGATAVYEVAAPGRRPRTRAAVAALLVVAVLALWAEGAVGIL